MREKYLTLVIAMINYYIKISVVSNSCQRVLFVIIIVYEYSC